MIQVIVTDVDEKTVMCNCESFQQALLLMHDKSEYSVQLKVGGDILLENEMGSSAFVVPPAFIISRNK